MTFSNLTMKLSLLNIGTLILDHIALDAMKNRLNGVKKRPEVSASDSNTIKVCFICQLNMLFSKSC